MKMSALTLHLPGGVLMTFQRVPDVGEPKLFRMGERGLGDSLWGFADPVVQVRVAGPFYLGTFPVTQAQFAAWTAAEKIAHENHFKDHPDHPAENLDWRQANGYCAWLTEMCGEQIPAGWLACLPTEAEWEYACRAGAGTEYYTGDGEAALAEAGWFGGNSENSTHPVGLKVPNAFGLYDLHGNVWEWCHDAFEGEVYRARVDGDVDSANKVRLDDWRAGLKAMLASSRTRVLRGGSWLDSAGICRSAFRGRGSPASRIRNHGFRVGVVPGPCPDGNRPAAPGDGGRGTSPESEGAGRAGGVPELAAAKLPRAAVENFF